MPAKFIVMEGLDGSGKTTQIQLLVNAMKQRGRRVSETAEPTINATGGLIRDALTGLTPRSPGEMAALFLADRVAHNMHPQSGIQKLLSEGWDVVSDRYYYSSLAYQGSQSDFDWVFHMNIDSPEIRKPDLCIFLDLTDEDCLRRMEQNRAWADIYENREALMKTRAMYYDIFRRLEHRDRIAIVNAAGTIEEVHAKVMEAVEEILD